MPLMLGVPFIQFLSTDGFGTGTTAANADFTGNPTTFFIQPFPKTTIYINSFRAAISDNALFNQLDYGAIAGGVTNGVEITVRLDGNVIDSLEGRRIKTNRDWVEVGFETQLTSFAGISQSLTVDNAFMQNFGAFLVLKSTGVPDRLSVTLSDNFSTLVGHTFIVRGLLQFG